jgi:hypothetical protein
MLMGRSLLDDADVRYADISHLNFSRLLSLLDERQSSYYTHALETIQDALNVFYNNEGTLSLKQLSATFWRGDLLGVLKKTT